MQAIIRSRTRKMVDADSIGEALEEIQHYVDINDHEAAHDCADRLWRQVLETIAAKPGICSCGSLARLALSVEKMGIKRWCA